MWPRAWSFAKQPFTLRLRNMVSLRATSQPLSELLPDQHFEINQIGHPFLSYSYNSSCIYRTVRCWLKSKRSSKILKTKMVGWCNFFKAAYIYRSSHGQLAGCLHSAGCLRNNRHFNTCCGGSEGEGWKAKLLRPQKKRMPCFLPLFSFFPSFPLFSHCHTKTHQNGFLYDALPPFIHSCHAYFFSAVQEIFG